MAEFPDQPPQFPPWTPPPPQPASGPWGYPPSQPYGYPPQPLPRNGLGATSQVLGIIALLACWVPFVGLVLGMGAVGTGFPARSRAKRGQAANDGGALTGIVLGIVAIVIGGAISAWVLYVIIDYQECIGHAQGRYEYSQCG